MIYFNVFSTKGFFLFKINLTFLIFLLLILSSCTNTKIESLESNKCPSCEYYFRNIVKLKSKKYSTKTLKNLGNQTPTDGTNWEKIAAEKFANKKNIYAVDDLEYKKFSANIHCLIGLELSKVKSFYPSRKNEFKTTSDSSLLLRIVFETIRNDKKKGYIWTGTKASRLYFEKKDRKYILAGSELQKAKLKRCISSAQ